MHRRPRRPAAPFSPPIRLALTTIGIAVLAATAGFGPAWLPPLMAVTAAPFLIIGDLIEKGRLYHRGVALSRRLKHWDQIVSVAASVMIVVSVILSSVVDNSLCAVMAASVALLLAVAGYVGSKARKAGQS